MPVKNASVFGIEAARNGMRVMLKSLQQTTLEPEEFAADDAGTRARQSRACRVARAAG
jgi:hypothetical protein